MRSLVLGAGGILGTALTAELESRSWSLLALARAQADIRDRAALERWVRDFAPEVIFNCAAFTHVDGCESQRELALEINGRAVGGLREIAAAHGSRLVQVSTDYVFRGDSMEAYSEEDPTGPLSVYGQSKLEGEVMALASADALVVRTSWLFGEAGPNFVDTIRRRVEEGVPLLKIVDDQVGCPTYSPNLAAALCDLAAHGARGLVHYCNRDAVTWYGFARAIVAEMGAETELRPVTTEEFPRPAPRPVHSVLAVDRAERILSRRVEEWRPGLSEYLGRAATAPSPEPL